MTVTVDVLDNPSLRLTDVDVGAVPPDTLEFAVEGTLSVSPDLLESFEGRRLRPVAVAVSVDGSTVMVDLGEGATLRLESVDLGLETPYDLPDGADGPASLGDDVVGTADAATGATDGVSETTDGGAISFGIEGTITGVSADAFDALSGGPAEPESITFAVEDSLATDGGAGDDVVLEVTIMGYGIAIRRDGSITIRRA